MTIALGSSMLATIANGFSILPYKFVSWYFGQLNIQVYERFFKIILTETPNLNVEWMDYCNFLRGKPLPDGTYLALARNVFVAGILFVNAITLCWHVLKRHRIGYFLHDGIIINPKRMVVAYLFLFLPLRNTGLFRRFQMLLIEAFPFSTVFENEMALFLLINFVFFISSYTIKGIKDRSTKFCKAYKTMINGLMLIKSSIILYFIFSIVFNVLTLIPDHPILITGSIILTIVIFAAEFYNKNKENFSVFLYEDCFKNIEKYTFLFIFLNLSMIFSVISAVYLMGWILFFEPIYKNFCLLASPVLGSIFTAEVHLVSVLCKIVLFYLFHNFISFIKHKKRGMI